VTKDAKQAHSKGRDDEMGLSSEGLSFIEEGDVTGKK